MFLVPAVLAACLAILFARRPDAFLRPQFWAEDGVFFYAAWAWGADALWQQYAGYLHTMPRLVAWLADILNPATAPAWYVGAAAALTLWVSGLALSERFPFRPRILCALAVPLVPNGFEVLLNQANVQWLQCGGLVALLVMDDPRTTGARIHDVVALVLVGLTGPFSTLFAPLFVLRALRRRTIVSAALAAIVVTTGSIQLYFLLRNPQPIPAGETIQLAYLVPALGFRTAGSLLFGALLPHPPVVGWLLAAVAVAGAVWLVLRGGPMREQRLWIGLALTVLLAAGLYRCRYMLPGLWNPELGPRYFFPAQLMLLWLLIHVLAEAKPARRWSIAALLALIVLVNLHRLREPALLDKRWGDYADRLSAREAVAVPINPHGWQMDLPPHWSRTQP